MSIIEKRTAMAKRLKRWGIATSLIGAVVFLLAGTWRDPWLWGYVGVWAVMAAYPVLGLDDDLAQERFRPPSAGADNVAVGFLRLFAVVHISVGALDGGRWHLNPPLPGVVRGLALAGMAVGLGMFYRAMRENRYFSSVVRIQTDRGHRVVDSGPYGMIRHPGYAGLVVVPLFSGLALGSWLAVAAGAVITMLVVRRVLFEDAFLRAHLDGYRAYAQRVPHRLIPGVW
jgi:protein-S-isoprenylcysteine O-methyltransferase Ste14